MKNIFRFLFILMLSLGITASAWSEQVPEHLLKKKSRQLKASTAGCSAGAAFRFLDVNNIRARINTGGDMWWDLGAGVGAQYYIPGNTTKTSLFSGSLWIGGLDVNDQLKLSALRYRQVGNDYWPGPLTVDGTAAVDAETCAAYDRFFKITREEVDEFLAWYNSTNRAEDYPDYSIPASITEWPAHGDVSKNQSYYLAPFFDANGDGFYDPNSGDYPYYDIDNSLCPINYVGIPDWKPTPTPETVEGITKGGILSDQVIKGDETLWWVFNDKGNFHSETQGASIGFEIRGQAFAFATNDEINNMTFYSYEIINRSTFRLRETYFSPWTDTDLGYAWDDYVGCDVGRGMGYCYNGNAIDGSGEIEAYGTQPPAIGVDFFQGPYMDPDQLDNPKFTQYIDPNGDTLQLPVVGPAINGVNFGNGIIDDERFGMRRFVYHNNGGADYMTDPEIAPEYYNYLRGIWKDGTKMLYGGNAHVSAGAVGPETDFMFPGDSDPLNWGTGGQPPNGGFNQNGLYWTEETAGNTPNDRRFMQSAGPFTLEPGATNYITVGIPWARAISGGPWASVELLRQVDDKCQSLFDNCFKVIDGPDAPELTFNELKNRFIVYISNRKTSNNYKEAYSEFDPNIQSPDTLGPNERWDSIYRFEGYQIFQLATASVGVESLSDPDKARLVAQFDKKNGVTKLVNYYYDGTLNANVPVMEVEGGDNGISHTFEITEDAFAEGTNTNLVNFKQYHYMAIAYAYNNFKEYSQFNADQLDGQKKPYLAGRKNIKRYTAIPHPTINGTVMNSDYGKISAITRIQGQGNGGMYLELDPATVNEILSKPPADTMNNTYGSDDYPIAYRAKYQAGFGPINMKVIDPLSVIPDNYYLRIDSVYSVNTRGNIVKADWELMNEAGKTWKSDTTIDIRDEQLLLDLGLSITWEQVPEPGDSVAVNNGLLGSSITYPDSSNQWLSGIVDNDTPPGSEFNWIRSGTYKDDENVSFNDWDMSPDPADPWDAGEYYERVINGTWAPYGMVAHSDQSQYGPAWKSISKIVATLNNTASIDVVFTPNKDLWTRCPVIEMCDDPALSEGNIERFDIRGSQSVDKDGNFAAVGSGPSTDPNAANYISETGMGWFPGYCINVETGERLNIMFGENSYLAEDNGRDMVFNPTSNYFRDQGTVVMGGMHFVYIMAHKGLMKTEQQGQVYTYNADAYDAGAKIMSAMRLTPLLVYQRMVFGSSMWVGMPIPGFQKEDDWLSQEAKVSMRVAKPYRKYYSVALDTTSTDTENDNNPLYAFSTGGLEVTYSVDKLMLDLDEIGVVPNPYYGYSSYEANPLDNRVRIINLPEQCIVSIFAMNGTLIRQYTKDEPVTYIDWDLKNFAGIPISGGAYLIHIEAGNDERIIKWFGTMRPVDLNTF